MDQTLNTFCFVCNQKAKHFRRTLDVHKAPSTQTPLNQLITKILATIKSNRCINNATDIICRGCVIRIHNYDRLYSEVQAAHSEISELLKRTDADSAMKNGNAGPLGIAGKTTALRAKEGDSVEPWSEEEMFSASSKCSTAKHKRLVLPIESDDIVMVESTESDDFDQKSEEEEEEAGNPESDDFKRKSEKEKEETCSPELHKCIITGCHRTFTQRRQLLVI